MSGQSLAGEIWMRTAIECLGYDCRAIEHNRPKCFVDLAVSGLVSSIV